MSSPSLQELTAPVTAVSPTSSTPTFTSTSTNTSMTRSPESHRHSSSSPRASNTTELFCGQVISPFSEDQSLQLQAQPTIQKRPSVTNDVASQTDNELSGMADEAVQTQSQQQTLKDSLAQPRRKLQEEIECEMLSKDLADRLQPDHRLLPLLVPLPEHKKSTDYVVDLFRVEAAPQLRPRPRLNIEDNSIVDSSDSENVEDKRIESVPTTPVTPSCPEPLSQSPPNTSSSSSYTNTALENTRTRFLARYSHEVINDHKLETISSDPANVTTTTTTTTTVSDDGGLTESITTDTLDLRQKKEELMMRLDKKLVVLRAEQEAVREEGELNEDLGARVSSRLSVLARPAEASKYRLHVEEVGKITSLLLGLSGRLARLENALYGMPNDHTDRKMLESKRDKLVEQLEEAKILKSNIDRRSVNVSAILSKYLTDDEFADYQHFINMKAKLIVEGREIQDKVKLGEEQLAALKEAIDL
ncbi:hypothetical protein QAD02_023710 [Eretmocerus hayati]|uniref:Uncharacterized protein n=1 Tax=Eretmocerus hayati TaxID=131215 RepID=A0ACC2Q1I1_9HYME|nr:hypothetical protein QAD02_023710 [Eretmocerus hayati]